MKIRVKKEDLLESLKKISPVCGSNSQPILNNVLIETGKKTIQLTGSNTVTSIRVELNCEILEEGKCLFSANKLAQIVETLTEDIELSDNLIESGKTKIKLQSEDVKFYPTELFKTKYNTEISIKSDILVNGIQKTISAAETKAIQNITSGINFVIKNNIANFYATNGSICANYFDDVSSDLEFDIILSQEVSKEIIRVFATGYDLTLNINDNSIMVSDENTILESRLMGGKFPDVAQFLKQDKESKMIISKQVLSSIIKRCQILRSNNKGELNILKFDIAGLTANIAFKDLLSEIVIIEKTGSDIKIAFDYELLNIGIKSINTDDVILEYNEALKPALIKDKNFLFLVAPCQIK